MWFQLQHIQNNELSLSRAWVRDMPATKINTKLVILINRPKQNKLHLKSDLLSALLLKYVYGIVH